MRSYFRSKIPVLLLLTICCIAFFTACRKNTNENTLLSPPDLTTKVTSSVSGFVTDENDLPVKNASVQFGTAIITTDKYGYFEAKNVEVVKDAATVTVTRPGYFKGIKTYIAQAGKSAFFRIKLIPKTIAGTVSASAGGTVTLSNGLSITLPDNSVITTTTNTVYTGTVNIAAYWINPVSNELPQIMPGDLRGVNSDGNVQLLSTYGMAAVELTGTGGELLQIASGKKAILSLPIPTALSSTAPATIPLWYFDEINGLWKQEGSANKTGSNYIGEVSHFSFWNYDVQGPLVQFDCTIITDVNSFQSVANAIVKISSVNNPANFRYAHTNAAGYVSGPVPGNAQLLLEVFSSGICTTPAYSTTFTTTNVPVSLGNINISTNNAIAIISGTVTNCSNNPVSNGYVFVSEFNEYNKYPLNSNGSFSFSRIMCGNTSSITLFAEDTATLQQSAPINITIHPGANAAGNLTACGISSQEYFYYSIDGTNYLLTTPQDSISFTGSATSPEGYVTAQDKPVSTHFTYIDFRGFGMAANSNQELREFVTSKIPSQVLLPTNPFTYVNIIEYGPVGQFVSGNFSGIFAERTNGSATHIVSGSFRTRRRT
ncbi:carboxypeptidase-like regulatory domain-containing protein [Ferruginibacter profundus]